MSDVTIEACNPFAIFKVEFGDASIVYFGATASPVHPKVLLTTGLVKGS